MAEPARPHPGAEAAVLVLLVACVCASLAFLAAYLLAGTDTQLTGASATGALLSIGLAIGIAAHRLLTAPEVVVPRHPPEPMDPTDPAVPDGGNQPVSRRYLLIGAAIVAIGTMTIAAIAPFLSLGPLPGRSLFTTSWRRGSRIVGFDGVPVRADAVPVDGILTVFPEGHLDDADSQAVMIRLDPARLAAVGQGATVATNDVVIFSKICTHAGCPVGLYRAPDGVLICPCHQSTFDVYRGATPTFGPAARALPALPIQAASDGTFVALGDFPEPVGPSFWDMGA
jgi:quinol---cytochrome c reductase iron-sulfur subunit